MKLSRDLIVGEAIALLSEQGIAEVTLRKLAARVHAQAPSLAPHVGGKAQLLALMSERIFTACVAAIPTCATWQDWLRLFGERLWQGQMETRDAGRLIALAVPEPAAFERMTALVVKPLVALGLDKSEAMVMQSAMQALVTGWVTFAQSAEASYIERALSIQYAFERSSEALISGFARHV